MGFPPDAFSHNFSFFLLPSFFALIESAENVQLVYLFLSHRDGFKTLKIIYSPANLQFYQQPDWCFGCPEFTMTDILDVKPSRVALNQ